MIPEERRWSVARSIELLLVEDNPGDVRLTIEALTESKVGNRLHVVPDGVEAMAFLQQEGVYAAAPRPDLVLLDLELPRKDGRQVLAEIKTSEALHSIPVVVLTASLADRDLLQSQEFLAAGYMTKPIDLQQLVALVRASDQFGLMVVLQPSREPARISSAAPLPA
jgi:two-component system, chemotaxis family, response regulator Rcp1